MSKNYFPGGGSFPPSGTPMPVPGFGLGFGGPGGKFN